jgi:hypothetical protein
MSHDTLATTLWTMLGISVVLTVFGITARSSWLLFVAAGLSFVFGIAAILSIGIFVLALAVGQLAIGIGTRRQTA